MGILVEVSAWKCVIHRLREEPAGEDPARSEVRERGWEFPRGEGKRSPRRHMQRGKGPGRGVPPERKSDATAGTSAGDGAAWGTSGDSGSSRPRTTRHGACGGKNRIPRRRVRTPRCAEPASGRCPPRATMPRRRQRSSGERRGTGGASCAMRRGTSWKEWPCALQPQTTCQPEKQVFRGIRGCLQASLPGSLPTSGKKEVRLPVPYFRSTG